MLFRWFWNIPETHSIWSDCGIELTSLGVVILSYISRPWLHCMAEYNYKHWSFTLENWCGNILSLAQAVFYIPPCRKTFSSLRNIKCLHGRGTKCSGTNRGGFSISRTATFQRRASFWLAFVTVREYVKNRLSNRRRQYFQLNPDHSVKICEWRKEDEPVWSKAVMIRKRQPINSLMMWIV